MPSQNAIYDGHLAVNGVDNSADPADASRKIVISAVNCAFRGGRIKTRPPFHSKRLIFDTTENEILFKTGGISGCFPYHQWRSYTQPHLIIAVHDRILKGRMFADTIEFSLLYKGIDPQYLHSWFAQGQDRMYWQNGVQRPVGWRGAGDAYVVEDGDDAMPIGTFMAYVKGRLLLIDPDGYLIISDYVYGNSLRDTSGLESWIEYQATNDIGALGPPAQLGEVTGIIAIPRQQLNGQGEALIMMDKGAYTVDTSGDRAQWLFGSIQQAALTGRGAASHDSLVAANNDIWYQSTDGQIASYKFDRGELEKSWGDTSLSREVTDYLKFSDRSRLRFVSGMLAHNRLLQSCAITLVSCKLGGAHRFGQGILSLDFDKGSSTTPRAGFAWDGLWTGPNPVAMVNLFVDRAERSLVISHDDDGINRIYEFMEDGTTGGDKLDKSEKKIQWHYDTPILFGSRNPSDQPTRSELQSIMVAASNMQEAVTFGIWYRPSLYSGWAKLPSITAGSDEAVDTVAGDGSSNALGGYYEMIHSSTVPATECQSGSGRLMRSGMSFQLRISGEGSATVHELKAAAILHQDPSLSTCAVRQKGPDYGLVRLTTDDDLFTYKIAPKDG